MRGWYTTNIEQHRTTNDKSTNFPYNQEIKVIMMIEYYLSHPMLKKADKRLNGLKWGNIWRGNKRDGVISK